MSQYAKALIGLRGGNQAVDDRITAMKRGNFRCLDRPHPFKIYLVPPILQANPSSPTAWLTFQVRSGYFQTTLVTGTDGADGESGDVSPDSYDIPLPLENVIQATAGANAFFIWIDATAAPTIKYDTNPANQGWSGYPSNDAQHILVGYIDTITFQAQSIAVIRQIQRTDVTAVPSGSGGGWVFYDPNATYTAGAQGLFVYNPSGPMTGLWGVKPGMTANKTTPLSAVTFPIPPTSPWQFMCFGPQPFNACSAVGGTQVLVNANSPV